MSEQIGLLGGTFDPVHFGHISIAKAFTSSEVIDQLWILPSPDPPHKDSGALADFQHRKRMLELAFREEQNIQIEDIESRLPKPSYTIQTVEYLQKRFPGITFYLCMGEDSLLDLERWHRAEDLIEAVPLLVAERPGQSVRKVNPGILKKTRFVVHEPIEISSTALRKKLARDKNNVDDFIPARVLEYIKKEGLYRSKKGE